MTLISVVLIGLGTLLIMSGIECQPSAATFQAVINNQTLDLSGNAPCGAAGGSAGTVKPTNGICPPGYYGPVNGVCITLTPQG